MHTQWIYKNIQACFFLHCCWKIMQYKIHAGLCCDTTVTECCISKTAVVSIIWVHAHLWIILCMTWWLYLSPIWDAAVVFIHSFSFSAAIFKYFHCRNTFSLRLAIKQISMRAQKEPFLLLSFMGIPVQDKTFEVIAPLSSNTVSHKHFPHFSHSVKKCIITGNKHLPSYSAASISWTFIIYVFLSVSSVSLHFNTKHIILFSFILHYNYIIHVFLCTFVFNFNKTIHMTCMSIF